MKVLFVNDSTSSSNWGDRAAATSLMAMVKQRGGRVIHAVTEQNLWDAWFGRTSLGLPDEAPASRSRELARRWIAPVVLDARRWALARRDGVGQDQHGLIPDVWETYEDAAARVRRERGYGWPVVLSAMDDAEVMVIHGASLHGDLFVARAILFLTFLMKTKFGKPVVIANHTSGLAGVLRRTAERVYPLFDDVVYRDPTSAEQWAPVYGGRFAADSGFWYRPASTDSWASLAGRPTYFDVWPDTARFDPREPYVCVGGSSIFHDRQDWASVLAGYDALIRTLRSTYPGTVVLTASAELDEPVFRTLAARFDLPLIGVRTPIQQAVDILGNADAYIGGRWHPAIFALRGGAPLIALSSQTVKMKALATMAGSAATFDALHLAHEADAISRDLSALLRQGSDLRKNLAAWAEKMAKNSWDNVAYLDGLRTSIG